MRGKVTTAGDYTSRRDESEEEDATPVKFPTCPTNYKHDPIADPEAGHMLYI